MVAQPVPSKLTLLRRLIRKRLTREKKQEAVAERLKPLWQRELAEWERFIKQYERGEL